VTVTFSWNVPPQTMMVPPAWEADTAAPIELYAASPQPRSCAWCDRASADTYSTVLRGCACAGPEAMIGATAIAVLAANSAAILVLFTRLPKGVPKNGTALSLPVSAVLHAPCEDRRNG
jgi:hypothetical protein